MDVAEHLALHDSTIVGLARKIAWHYKLGRHAWKDLAQEAREELIQAHNGRYDHDRASLLTYAYKTMNWRMEAVAQDFISKTDPNDGWLFDQLAATEDDDLVFADPDVQAAWNMLDEAEKTTLWLYAIHDTLADAAEAAEVSVPTFRKRRNAAAEKCRRFYYGEGAEGLVSIAKRRGRPRGRKEAREPLRAS
jgi:DNA-directed RNA polymerase specialized sigma24 family protein